MDFDFFTKLVDGVDSFGVFEAHECLILSSICTRKAVKHSRYIRNGARFVGVVCWQEVLNHLFCMYKTPAATFNAVSTPWIIRQEAREDEIIYSEHINDAAHRRRNVQNETDKIAMLVNGLLSSLQTFVARFPESKSHSKLFYKELD